jgi:hypothetical protein
MGEPFLDFYRCPDHFGNFTSAAELRSAPGYFRFGDEMVCYGQCAGGHSSRSPKDALFDAFQSVNFNHSSVRLPFDIGQVIDNLRLERYPRSSNGLGRRAIRRGYYSLRPLLALGLRKHLQKLFLRGWETTPFPEWPVDTTVDRLFEKLMALSLKTQCVEAIPFIWFWPEGASSCVVMTHDVETEVGARFCSMLMDIDDAWEIKASFQIVPEGRYPILQQFLDSIRQRGFELNVQDLNHDGLLFDNREEFLVRAAAINRYAQMFGSRGFRAAVMYRNPDWYEALDFSYDLSIPNAAHLEPQHGGCCTVFPYFVGKILEIPLTTVQDYSLFHILNDYSIELWKRQIDLVQRRYGLVSFIIHPDYITAKRALEVYLALLEHLAQLREEGSIWTAMPGEVDRWWRARARMQLVLKDGHWTIEGQGSERARVAFATLNGEEVEYSIGAPGRPQPCPA